MITAPYRHPRRFKDEIEKAINELLVMGHMTEQQPICFFSCLSSEEGCHHEDVN